MRLRRPDPLRCHASLALEESVCKVRVALGQF